MYKWFALGFDVRVEREPVQATDARDLVTVDRNYWPRPAGTSNLESHLNGTERYTGPYASYFESLDSLLTLIKECPPNEPFQIVHVSRLNFGWPHFQRKDGRLSTLEQAFKILYYRYDIADIFCLSGLYNCGLLPSELGLSVSDNSFPEIESVRAAIPLVSKCNQLVPEHAPFYVFRICAIGEIYFGGDLRE